MQTDYSPCRLVDLGDGRYSLIFFDFQKHHTMLRQEGGHGGGYSWESLISAVLEMRGMEFDDVEFDPEAEMFSAVSNDLEALEQIAGVIRELDRDAVLMEEAVEHAKEGGYFE